MSYVAKHYTEIAGCKYTPGEVISKPIPAEKAERLLRLGAIEPLMKMVPAAEADEESSTSDEDGYDPEVVLVAMDDDGGDDAEDAEAPVVDVMDGIVAPDPAEETASKPKTNTRRKKA